MAIGQFSFEWVKRPTHIQSVGLQDVQIDRFATCSGYTRLSSVVNWTEVLCVFHAWHVQWWMLWYIFVVIAGTPPITTDTIRHCFVTLIRGLLTLIWHEFIWPQIVFRIYWIWWKYDKACIMYKY